MPRGVLDDEDREELLRAWADLKRSFHEAYPQPIKLVVQLVIALILIEAGIITFWILGVR